MRARPPLKGEEGSALIIALIFVTAVALMVAAILSFSEAGLLASKTYQAKGKWSYAADGATTAAIKRYGTTGPCDDFTAPPINTRAITVRCQGPPPAGSKATEPQNSLLALGTHSGDGITSSQDLHLLGDVYSKTDVTVAPTATMIVQGQVSAEKTCDGPIQTLPANGIHCAATTPTVPSTADTSRGRDPDYTKAASSVPMRRTVPPCPSAAEWLIPLEAGYYDDADALTKLTGRDPVTGSTYCDNKVLWFRPGTYYFDFGFSGGSSSWIVDNPSIVVVGGTPKGPIGWDLVPNPAANAPTLSVPGACRTESDPAPNDGVQVIAGGATHLEVDKGRMELCATSKTGQQIALFGLGPVRSTHTLESTSITTDGFTDALNAQTIGETPCGASAPPCPLAATASLSAAGPNPKPSASLKLTEFRPGVPSGSLIDAVSLRFVHQEAEDPVDLTWTASFTDSTCGGPAPQSVPAPVSDGSHVDLKAFCGLVTPEQLSEVAVTYTASLGAGSSTARAQVDGAVLEVAYRIPTTRKPTAFLTPTGFGNPERALEIGEVGPLGPGPPRGLLTANADLRVTPTASITLEGLGDPPLPAGSTTTSINSAVLRVAHRDEGDTGGPTVTVPLASGPCTKTLDPQPAAIADDRSLDLKACGITPSDLKGLTATFTATLNPGGASGTSRLDGMWLEVVSTDPPGPATALPAVRRATYGTSTAADPTTAVFTTPELATQIDEPAPSTADATIAGGATSANLTVNDFNRLPLPPGSRIRSATLRVAHQEDANVASLRAEVMVPAVPGHPGGTCGPVVLPPALVGSTTAVPLVSCGLSSPDQLGGLTATYSAVRTSSDTQVSLAPIQGASAAFVPAEQGRSIDDALASAALSPTTSQASISLGGFGPGGIPDGSIIDSATLHLKHKDDAGITSVKATVTFGGKSCVDHPLNLQPTLKEDTVDLAECGGLTDLTDLSGPRGLAVVYRADIAPGTQAAVDSIDGARLDVSFRPPAVDHLDGIELDVLFQAPAFVPLCNDCDLLKVAPAAADGDTRFVASGTIYAPSAGVDISMSGLDRPVLNRGVIARSIRLGLKPTASYKRPTGSIPPEVATFTAYPDQTMNPTEVTTTGFTNLDNAKAPRDPPPACPPASPPCPPATADAHLDGTLSLPVTTASLNLKHYGPSTLPDAARFDASLLRIRHQDSGNTVQVTVKVAGATCLDHQVLAANPTTLSPGGLDGEDQIELPVTCGLTDSTKLDDVMVTYDVFLDSPAAATATASLDGITLEVLSGPLVRASVTFDRAKATIQHWNVLR